MDCSKREVFEKPVVVSPSFEILPDQMGLEERIETCGRICYKSEDLITKKSAPGFCRKMTEHKHNSVLEMGVVSYRVSCNSFPYIADMLATIPKFLIIDNISEHEWLITGSVRAFRESYMLFPKIAVFSMIAKNLSICHPCFFKDLNMDDVEFFGSGVICERVPLAKIDGMSKKLQARHRHVAVRFIVNRAVTHEIVRHRPCAFLQESQRYCRYSEGKFGSRVTFIKPMFFKEGSKAYQLWEQAMLETERIYLSILEEKEGGDVGYTPQAARTVLPNSCKTELIVYANLEQWHHILHMRVSSAAEPSMREVMIPLQQEFIKLFPDQDFGEPLRMPEGWVKA